MSGIPDKPVARSECGFVILRYDGKVPAMASCGKYGRKFYTLATFARDAVGICFVDTTGTTSTVVGNGTRGFSGDGESATAAELDTGRRLRRFHR